MHQLEYDYLQRNNFIPYDFPDDNKIHKSAWYSNVILDGKFCEKGFSDQRQIAIIKAQFGNSIKDICHMRIDVEQVNDVEWDTAIIWDYGTSVEIDSFKSQIGGEGLYELVSQAIVLANC